MSPGLMPEKGKMRGYHASKGISPPTPCRTGLEASPTRGGEAHLNAWAMPRACRYGPALAGWWACRQGRANHAPFGGGGAPCKSSAGLGFAGGNGGRSAWSVPWPCGKWQRGGNTQAKHGSWMLHLCRNKGAGIGAYFPASGGA